MDRSSRSEVSPTNQPHTSDRSILLVAKGGGVIFVGTLFAYGSRMVIGILLARLLGAEHYGLYRLTLTAGTIGAALALLGLEYALVRYVALFASRQDTSGLWGTLQVGLGLTTIASLLIGAGLFALATPIAEHLFHEPRLVPLLRLASLIVPFLALTNALMFATRGFGKMQFAVIAEQTVQPLARLILILLVALIGLSVAKAVSIYILGLIITCALLLYFLNLLFPLRRPLKTARRDISGMLRFSLPAYFSRLIDTFGPNLQTVLLGTLNSVTTVGIFGAATQVSTIGNMFNGSIGTASLPIVSELHDRGDLKEMNRFYQTTTKWMFTMNLPLLQIVLLLARPILAIFGEDFVGGSTALTILAWARLATASAGISGGVLEMTGNTSLRLVNSAILTALTIGLSISLIPRWGAVGAAAAVLAAITVVNLLRVSEVFILFRMLPYNVSFVKPAVAGLVALAIGWLIRLALHTEAYLIAAAMNAFAILAVYVSMILLLGLSPEDRALLARLRRRVAAAFSGV
jgi:O-antigen/teichoic acid export membrane protein